MKNNYYGNTATNNCEQPLNKRQKTGINIQNVAWFK